MSNPLFWYLNRSSPRLLTSTHRLVAVGIAMAVAMLLVTIAIMEGFWDSYGSAARGFHGDIILIQDPEGPVPDSLMTALRTDPDSSGIAAESPFLLREGLLTGGDGVNGVVVKGVNWQQFLKVHPQLLIRWDADGETKFSSAHPTSMLPIILGSALDGSQRPTHIFLSTPAHPVGELIPIQVVGTFTSGLYDYDHQFVLVPMSKLQRLYRLSATDVNGVTLRLNKPDETWRLARSWQDEFLFSTITTWGELNKSMFDALRLQRSTFVVLMSLFVLIALSNVTGVVGLQVWFRRNEGAILKLVGLSNSRLRRLIWRSAFKTSLLGVTVGIVLGVGTVWLLQSFNFIALPESVYFVHQLPLQLHMLWVLLVALGTLSAAGLVTSVAVFRMVKIPILRGLVRL